MTREIATAVNHQLSPIGRSKFPEWNKKIYMMGVCVLHEVLSCWLLIADCVCAYVFTCRWLCNRFFSAVHLLCWFSITLLAPIVCARQRACFLPSGEKLESAGAASCGACKWFLMKSCQTPFEPLCGPTWKFKWNWLWNSSLVVGACWLNSI